MEGLLSAKRVGEIMELSKRQVFRLNSAGKIPKPLKIGGSVRWNESEIFAWINSGCPDRQTWEQIKGDAA